MSSDNTANPWANNAMLPVLVVHEDAGRHNATKNKQENNMLLPFDASKKGRAAQSKARKEAATQQNKDGVGKKKQFGKDEDAAILKGQKKFGNNWEEIRKAYPILAKRKASNLRQRFQLLQSKKKTSTSSKSSKKTASKKNDGVQQVLEDMGNKSSTTTAKKGGNATTKKGGDATKKRRVGMQQLLEDMESEKNRKKSTAKKGGSAAATQRDGNAAKKRRKYSLSSSDSSSDSSPDSDSDSDYEG